MILTGREIAKEVEKGNIEIDPFLTENINPNSYNYRLGDSIKILVGSEKTKPIFKEVLIPDNGLILEPHTVYLANTFEVIGSSKYAMSLIGRSSIGRLGLFLQISANLGHTNSKHKWTLELVAAHKIVVYKNMRIGQVSFWENCGEIMDYGGIYGKINHIKESQQ